MKKLIASIFILALLGATAANAGVRVGVHVGDVRVHVSDRHHHHRTPHCVAWRWSHHRHHNERYCVRWSRW